MLLSFGVHATGNVKIIPALTKAALAVGADGVMVEMHPNPKAALCDGEQSLDFDTFGQLMNDLKSLAPSLDRVM